MSVNALGGVFDEAQREIGPFFDAAASLRTRCESHLA
jgi:hypothetical protein